VFWNKIKRIKDSLVRFWMETGYLSKGKDSRKGHKGLTQRSQSQAPTHLKQIQVTHPALRTLRLPYFTLREPSLLPS
jgi:hypothetical protein